MRTKRRSEGRPRRTAAAGTWGVLVAFLAGGCQVPLVEMRDIMDPNAYQMVEQQLGPEKLARNMKEIDEQYTEPRTPAKVRLSLETAELSISPENDYAALWRGARACAWLARNHPERDARGRFAKKGVAMGRKACDLLSTRVEPYYYTALSLGAFAQVKQDKGFMPSRKVLEEARYFARMAIGVDPAFDHAGPHRFLGKLMVESSASLTHAVGSFEEGVEHLETAVEIAPDFAQNRLFLAQAYLEDDRVELARAQAEEILASSPPEDYTSEHQRWINEAGRIFGKVPGGEEPSVDVSGYEEEDATASGEATAGPAPATASTEDAPPPPPGPEQ